jgi:hypothetical protein
MCHFSHLPSKRYITTNFLVGQGFVKAIALWALRSAQSPVFAKPPSHIPDFIKFILDYANLE